MQHDDPKSLLEIGGWIICGMSAVFAGSLLIVGKVGIDVPSLGVPLLILAFLVGAYIVYRWWRHEPVISDICGALAVMVLSAAAADIISLAGLHLGAPLIDGTLAAYDSAVLLDTRSIVVAVANAPAFGDLLGVAYVSSFPILIATVVFLGWKRHVKSLWQLAFVFAFTVVACSVLAVYFPAAGAFFHFAYPAEVLDRLPAGAGVYHLAKFDYYRNAVAPIISMSNLQGVVTFPSFHCCVALMTAFAFIENRCLFAVSLFWNGLVIVSTIPIGGHYIVDLPAGAALWALACVLATVLWLESGKTTLNLQPSETASD